MWLLTREVVHAQSSKLLDFRQIVSVGDIILSDIRGNWAFIGISSTTGINNDSMSSKLSALRDKVDDSDEDDQALGLFPR